MILMVSKILERIPLAIFQAALLCMFHHKWEPEDKIQDVIKQKKKAFLLGMVLCYLVEIGTDLWFGNTFAVKICFEAAIICLLSFILFCGHLRTNILAAVYTFATIQVLHLMVGGILELLKAAVTPAIQSRMDAMLGQNMYNILLYILFIGFKLYSGRKTRQKFIVISFVSCIFAVGQIVFYYYLFLSNPSGLSDKIVGVATICSIVILFVHGAMLELMERIVENQKKQNETEKKLLEKKYEYDYYVLAEEQAEAVKKIHDDMRFQLQNVQKLMQEEDETKHQEAEDILGELEDKISHFGRVYYCDDAVLNTILSLKQEKARKLAIEMEIQVDSVVPTELEDIDLCSVVTNLLDNAIEATEKVKMQSKETENPKIIVRVGHRGGYLVMQVENPLAVAPVKNKKGRFITSKKTKTEEHGRGLGIVEKTVEKCGGHLDFKEEDGQVIATAFMKEASERMEA